MINPSRLHSRKIKSGNFFSESDTFHVCKTDAQRPIAENGVISFHNTTILIHLYTCQILFLYSETGRSVR